MRCMDGENEMLLTCREQADGVSILRCETRDPVVLLPDEVDGAPVISLGKYALSGRAPDLAGEKTFSFRVTCGGALPVHQADSIRAVTAPASAESGRKLCVLQLPCPRGADHDKKRFGV